jgi:hypothetical protein
VKPSVAEQSSIDCDGSEVSPSGPSKRTIKLQTIPQSANKQATTVTGMKISGAFFFGLYSSPSKGLSNNDITQLPTPNDCTFVLIGDWSVW